MNQSFWKTNIVPLVCLIVTIGSILINFGINQGRINEMQGQVTELKAVGSPIAQKNTAALVVLQKDFDVLKSETKEKIRDMETLAREANDKMNVKLDDLSKQLTTVVAWIEEQKRRDSNSSHQNSSK